MRQPHLSSLKIPRGAPHPRRRTIALGIAGAVLALFVGCTPMTYRQEADRRAYRIIEKKQLEALGHAEPFTIETPTQTLRRRLLLEQELPTATPASRGTSDVEPIKQWPDKSYLKRERLDEGLIEYMPTDPVLQLNLSEALQIGAHESRDYQQQKENVYKAALKLDLERDAFRRTWTGVLSSLFDAQPNRVVPLDDKGHTRRELIAGFENDGVGGLSQQLKNGFSFTTKLGVDLVSLMTQDRLYSRGLYADVSATLPLMRGAGEFVVTEPLTQAERDVVYAIYSFEQFKKTFAVDVANQYLSVLQQRDAITNAAANYESLVKSTRRARRLAETGRLPGFQVDQSRTDELRARQRWVAALGQYQRRLDSFKTTLGLPVDARVELDETELDRLVERARQDFTVVEGEMPEESVPAADAPVELVPAGAGLAGPFELEANAAIRIALDNRLDLRVAVGGVFDSQRAVAVAADQLRADVTLLGTGSAGSRRSLGSVSQNDAILRPDQGSYSALLTLDLPFERTRERNGYRTSLLAFELAVRDVQDLEDQIKLAVRNRLSELLEARESIRIQAAALQVAKRRVDGTRLSLDAGRAQVRDVLDAEDALLTAQNALTSALINYRLTELSLQRDLGVLAVNEKGLWQEYSPERKGNSDEPQPK